MNENILYELNHQLHKIDHNKRLRLLFEYPTFYNLLQNSSVISYDFEKTEHKEDKKMTVVHEPSNSLLHVRLRVVEFPGPYGGLIDYGYDELNGVFKDIDMPVFYFYSFFSFIDEPYRKSIIKRFFSWVKTIKSYIFCCF